MKMHYFNEVVSNYLMLVSPLNNVSWELDLVPPDAGKEL